MGRKIGWHCTEITGREIYESGYVTDDADARDELYRLASPSRQRRVRRFGNRALAVLGPLCAEGWWFYMLTATVHPDRRNPAGVARALAAWRKKVGEARVTAEKVLVYAIHGEDWGHVDVHFVVASPSPVPDEAERFIRELARRGTGGLPSWKPLYLKLPRLPGIAGDDEGRWYWSGLPMVARRVALERTIRYLEVGLLKHPLWRDSRCSGVMHEHARS